MSPEPCSVLIQGPLLRELHIRHVLPTVSQNLDHLNSPPMQVGAARPFVPPVHQINANIHVSVFQMRCRGAVYTYLPDH